MVTKEIDSVSKDLTEKTLVVDIDTLNEVIRKHHFYCARVIKREDLEKSEKESLFVCVVEKGKTFEEIISQIYKVFCTKCRYDGASKVKIYYREI